MTTPAEIAEFIRLCRASTLTERSGSQSHFIALCRVLGLKPPLEDNPRGDWFTFEKGTKKTGGGGIVSLGNTRVRGEDLSRPADSQTRTPR